MYDVVVFKIERFRKDDSRNTGDDYWLRMATEGCGCCADQYTGIHTAEQIVTFIKRWIKTKEKEIEKWKKATEEIEAGTFSTISID